MSLLCFIEKESDTENLNKEFDNEYIEENLEMDVRSIEKLGMENAESKLEENTQTKTEDQNIVNFEKLNMDIISKLVKLNREGNPEMDIIELLEMLHLDDIKSVVDDLAERIFSHLDGSDIATSKSEVLRPCIDEIKKAARERPALDALYQNSWAKLRNRLENKTITNEHAEELACLQAFAGYLELEEHRIGKLMMVYGEKCEEYKIIPPIHLRFAVDQVLVNEHLIVFCAYKATSCHLRVHDRWNFKLINALCVNGEIDHFYLEQTSKKMAINCSTKYGHYQPIVWDLETGQARSVFIVRNTGYDCIYCDTTFFAYVSHVESVGHILSVFKENDEKEKFDILFNEPISFGALPISEIEIRRGVDFYYVLGFGNGGLRCCQLRSTTQFSLLHTIVYDSTVSNVNKVKPKVCLVGGLFFLVENLQDRTIEARLIHSSNPIHVFDMNAPLSQQLLKLENLAVKNNQVIVTDACAWLGIWDLPPDLLFDWQERFSNDDEGIAEVTFAQIVKAPSGTISSHVDEFGVLQFRPSAHFHEEIVVRILRNTC